MKPQLRHAIFWAASMAVTLPCARAQRGMGDWMTSGFDAQRSSWVRNDAKISPSSLSKPGFELVWKYKIDNPPRQLYNLTAPALLDFYIGYKGFRTLGFFGGVSNRLVTLDTDLARLEWEKSFAPLEGNGTLPCPGGMTSAVTRPTSVAYPGAGFIRGLGRATPATSAVGLPHEGAVTLKEVPAQRPRPATPPSKPSGASGDVPSPFAPRVQWIVALSGDGLLHHLWVSNGHEPQPPIRFLPPNAHARGLIVFDNTAYVATSNGCGGVSNGVWALDLATQKVTQWKASAKGVAGAFGPAVGPDGTLYAADGNQLVALAPRTLQQMGALPTGGPELSSTPVVFQFKGKNLIAAATSDGRLLLADTADLSKGPLAWTPVFSSANYDFGALASWEDEAGTRWVLAPAGGSRAAAAGLTPNGEIKNGAIVAWKVVDKGGAPAFEPGWASRDMVSPLTPAIVNGVVFAVSSGEYRSSDPRLTAAQRAARSTNAVLYALDGATGKELWNSGNLMTSFVHSGGLSAGGTRVYVSTYDGMQYAFGFPIEH